jgi:hypothetical protein
MRVADTDQILIGTGAHQDARRLARYGRTDWLAWFGRDGKQCAARRTPATLKRAMLDTGTQGRFLLICKNDGVGMIAGWSDGARWLRQLKRGYL